LEFALPFQFAPIKLVGDLLIPQSAENYHLIPAHPLSECLFHEYLKFQSTNPFVLITLFFTPNFYVKEHKGQKSIRTPSQKIVGGSLPENLKPVSSGLLFTNHRFL
jgi:hypothetical protein